MIWWLVAWFLERAHILISRNNYTSRWNGFGVIDDVLKRNTKAPMVYRVLVPWIIGSIERIYPPARLRRLEIYELLKIALMGLALWAIARSWSWEAAAITAILLPITFCFDYWDWAGELAGISLAMTGEMPLVLIGLVIAGLSKETAPLVALAYLMVTGDLHFSLILILLAGVIWVALRLIQGEHELYCNRFMVRRNWHELKDNIRTKPFFLSNMTMTLVVTFLALMAITQLPTGWVVPLAILGVGWTLAVAAETRIFVVVLPWIAEMMLR